MTYNLQAKIEQLEEVAITKHSKCSSAINFASASKTNNVEMVKYYWTTNKCYTNFEIFQLYNKGDEYIREDDITLAIYHAIKEDNLDVFRQLNVAGHITLHLYYLENSGIFSYLLQHITNCRSKSIASYINGFGNVYFKWAEVLKVDELPRKYAFVGELTDFNNIELEGEEMTEYFLKTIPEVFQFVFNRCKSFSDNLVRVAVKCNQPAYLARLPAGYYINIEDNHFLTYNVFSIIRGL